MKQFPRRPKMAVPFRRSNNREFGGVVSVTFALWMCITVASAWPSSPTYSKVQISSSNDAKDAPDPSRIHQAPEISSKDHLWFPQIFNKTTDNSGLKAAIDRSDSEPIVSESIASESPASESRSYKSSRQRVSQIASDRFVPGADSQFVDSNNDKDYGPYLPPPGLHSFPPNSNVDYNKYPTVKKEPIPSISSYLPAAAGPVDSNEGVLRTPTEYGPPPSVNAGSISSYLPAASGPVQSNPIASPIRPNDNYGPPNHKPNPSYPLPSDHPTIPFRAPETKVLPTQPPPVYRPPEMRPQMKDHPHPPAAPPSDSDNDYQFDYTSDHDDHHPPQFLDHAPSDFHSGPPIDHGAEHGHHPPSFPDHHSYPGPPTGHDDFQSGPPTGHDYGGHGIDASPEIIFDSYPDHDHDFDFHHHHHHPPPPPPPPPPTPVVVAETPRVKKYSYFYLGRKLWYVPLYFTVWFTFYVTYLILQSIGRHKVDLPNHLVNRRSVRDDSHMRSVERVNALTEFVMSQISGFKDKQV